MGTWVTPDEIIPGRHQNAWRISSENLARGNEGAIERLKEESSLMTLLSLVKEVPLGAFRELQSKHDDDQKIMRALAEAYRSRLRRALELYERDDEEDTEEAYRLRCVLVNMARAVFHWAGKHDGSG